MIDNFMTISYQPKIGQRIRARREFLGLSQPQVAVKLGVSRSQLGHYETGHSEMTASDVIRLAKILRVSISYLLDFETETYLDEDTSIETYFNQLSPEIQAPILEMVKAAYRQQKQREVQSNQTKN